MGPIFVIAWLSLGGILTALLVLAQRKLLDRAPPARRGPLAPVSVLKPLRGADPSLEANLTTIFRQDHPSYEVLLGAADADDPALAVARRVAAAHPHVPSRVIADARRVGANPKVNNLANLARAAAHEVLVVSDSNVAVAPSYLSDLAARLDEPGTGLVSSPIVAHPAGSLGSDLESLQLNTYVMGGVGAVTLWFRGVCCVGKSMAFRRADLDALGGFAFLGRHLAEDQVGGEEFARAGHGVTVATAPVENVLGPLTVRDFVARHLRWARIRRWVNPPGYAGEILANPVAACIAAFLALPLPAAAVASAALLAARAVADALMERRLGVRRPLASYLPLLLLKETLIVATWPVPWFDRTVEWRGNRFRLSARTRLEPVRAPDEGHALAFPDVVLDDDPHGDPVAATV